MNAPVERPTATPAQSKSGKSGLTSLLVTGLVVLIVAIAFLRFGKGGFDPSALLSGSPTENDGERLMVEKINEQAEGRITLVSFKKLDGQSKKHQGVDVYLMTFEAKIHFNEDCMWGPAIGNQWRGKFATEPGIPRSTMGDLGHMDQRPGRKGGSATLSGTLIFQKLESGWKGGISPTGGTVSDAGEH